MRTPTASSIALAIAGATGEIGFSPMPLTLYGPTPLSLSTMHGLELRNILDVGNFVFAEVGHFDSAVLHRQVFDQAIADALNDAAIDLSLMAHRVHDRAGVMGGGQLAQRHFSCLRIDGDLGDLRRKCGHRRMIVIASHRFAADRAADALEEFVPALPFLGFLVHQNVARKSDLCLRPTEQFLGQRE